MKRRKSIVIDAFKHANPIPHASRVGNVLVSGGIPGFDPRTGKPAATLEEQCKFMFAHVRSILDAADATAEDVVKMTIWLVDPSQKTALNDEWVRMFPDEESRPARHTQPAAFGGGMLVQCDLMAVIEER